MIYQAQNSLFNKISLTLLKNYCYGSEIIIIMIEKNRYVIKNLTSNYIHVFLNSLIFLFYSINTSNT